MNDLNEQFTRNVSLISRMSLEEVRAYRTWLEESMNDPFPDDDFGGDLMIANLDILAAQREQEIIKQNKG